MTIFATAFEGVGILNPVFVRLLLHLAALTLFIHEIKCASLDGYGGVSTIG